MFGAISKLFRKSEPAPAGSRSTPTTTQPAQGKPASPVSTPVSRNETPGAGAPAASSGPGVSAVPRDSSSSDLIQVPYAAVIKQVPQELWGRLAPAGVAGATFPVFMQQVLDQLPQGSVKTSFGELRRNAPAGVFTNSAAQDGRVIDLPLPELISQLHPDLLARRQDQVPIVVSDEVPDLFGSKGERLAPLRVMDKKEASVSIVKDPSGTTITNRQNQPVTPGNILPVTPSMQTPPTSRAPAAPAKSDAPSKPISMRPSAAPAPAASNPPIPFPKPAAPAPSSAPAAAKPLPKPAPTLAPALSSLFYIGLDSIAEHWPTGIRQELARLKIPDAKVGLPPVEICEGLKRGMIQYPWKTIRSWIQPAPNSSAPSPFDDAVVSLPLERLTPIFLEFIRANPVNRRAAAADNITEFFRKAAETSDAAPEMTEAILGLAPKSSPPPPAPAPAFAFQPPAKPAPAPVPSAKPAPSASAPVAAPAPAASSAEGAISIPLSQVSAGWPEPVVHDISQFNLTQATVQIPIAQIDAGLKAGRIEFTWRQLCSWLNPASSPAQVSINGDNKVVLPLNVVAPLFMKQRSGGQARKKTNINQEIPDLFSAAGQPQPQAPVAEPAAVSSAPAAAPAPVAATPAAAAKKAPANLNELFNDPDRRTWTPNDIVHKAVTLPGVAGALIALQDGLLVSACMPPTVKGETIAAFVPQIFGRMNQYTKELKMGDCRGISLTVEGGTLQIFSAGIIYFAALGAPEALLPLPELELIARELSRHTK